MEQAERSGRVDYCCELPAWGRVFWRIGYLNGQSCCPVVHTFISWIVFVGESHAALYGKWQPRLGGLEYDRSLISSLVEPLCYFLVSCSGSATTSYALRQRNTKTSARSPPPFTPLQLMHPTPAVL